MTGPSADPLPGRERVSRSFSLLHRERALCLALAAGVLLLFAASLAMGRVPLPWSALTDSESVGGIILREIRLPRALLALLTGATLGLTGAVLQGLLRNPLAEPGLVGISAAAALGAVLVFYYGLSRIFPLALPLGGMTGALLAVALIYALAGRDSGVTTLILAGVAVNSLAAALTALALNLAPSPYAATEILFWLLGSFADRSFQQVWLMLPFTLLGWLLLIGTGRSLDALSLGEDSATSLGVNLGRLRWRIILATAFAVGAATSVAGSIGFVGLVVPHLLRPLVGYRPGALLLPSALGGAALTLAADIAVRLAGPTELRIGVFTALLGAPFFLWLVLQTRKLLP